MADNGHLNNLLRAEGRRALDSEPMAVELADHFGIRVRDGSGRYRFRLSCRHWTVVLSADECWPHLRAAVNLHPVECVKCHRMSHVGAMRELAGSAKRPEDTRAARDAATRREAAQLRSATQQPDRRSHGRVP